MPLLIRAVAHMHGFIHVKVSGQWMLTLLQILSAGLNFRNCLISLNISVFIEWYTKSSQNTTIAALPIESFETKIQFCSTLDSLDFLYLLY